MLKGGPHLLCQLFIVFHLCHCHQLPLPARHFASFSLPHYPLAELFHWGFRGGHLFFFLFQVLGQPSEKAGDLRPQFWWLLQIGVLGSHCLSARLPVSYWGVVFEVGGGAVFRWHLAAPLLLPSGSMYLAFPTLWSHLYLWPIPGKGTAEPLYLLFQDCCFWWASLTLAKLLSTEASLLPLLGVLLLGGQASVDWDLTAISGAFFCFHPWQCSK